MGAQVDPEFARRLDIGDPEEWLEAIQKRDVVSIDLKRSWRGKPKLHSAANLPTSGRDWREVLRACIAAGAGEILLNVVDRDGTMSSSTERRG